MTVDLSVLIPTRQEAGSLPLLLADLQRWPGTLQILIADAGSNDETTSAARIAGATVLNCPTPGRGHQLRWAVQQAQGHWLLVLHADSRLSTTWSQVVQTTITTPGAASQAFYFDLRIDGPGAMLRLLEGAVQWRCRCFQEPYGDQGLLIHRSLYEQSGGYSPLPLMEDLELVQRLKRLTRLRPLNQPIRTSARRWQRDGVIQRSWTNAQLRRLWRRGVCAEELVAAYNKPFSWRTKRHSGGPGARDPIPDADKN
ncbi:MAG: TIGR04283 family arsenosugar biosynthesis glycosyltransferase [Synechococcus sp.]